MKTELFMTSRDYEYLLKNVYVKDGNIVVKSIRNLGESGKAVVVTIEVEDLQMLWNVAKDVGVNSMIETFKSHIS